MYNDIYKRKKKSTNRRLKKKKKKKWLTKMERQMNNEKRCMNSAKNTVEKRAQIDDWEKIKINNKKSDEQYILNKPKVL